MDSTGSSSSAPAPDVGTAVEIVIGVTSQNNAETIGEVVRACHDGVARAAPSRTARIVVADAASSDGTRNLLHAGLGGDPSMVAVSAGSDLGEVPYHGRRGRAEAIKAILVETRRLGATCCVVIDAGLKRIGPEWVERLVLPIVADDFDYVSPHFHRHVDEGAITKAIVAPLVRALYGVRLRQPAASEFGCSHRLLDHYLEQDFWDTDGVTVAIDLWLTTAAIAGGFRVCEAELGPREGSHDGPSLDLGTTLAQIVGALFSDLEQRVDLWQRVRGSTVVPIVGTPIEDGRSRKTALHADSLLESFRLGDRELRDVWSWVLPPRTLVELRRLADAGPGHLRFDDTLWATIVYDFALAYGLRVLPRDQLLRSLTPLYAGWLAWFIAEVESASRVQAAERLERVCLGFESAKRHLISRWRWPERLR